MPTKDTTPRTGDFWRHDTMPEKVEVIGARWSDGIRWIEVAGASGETRYWQEWEWHAWAKNATRLPPRAIVSALDAMNRKEPTE